MEFFGLDIGTSSIKACQLAREGERFRLKALGLTPTPGQGLASEAEKDWQATAETIKRLLTEARITTRSVATAFPEGQVFTRVIEMPKLSAEELASAIRWEAEQYIPVPLDEVSLDHLDVSPKGSEKTEVLLVAAPKTLINKYFRVLEMAGLSAVSMETELVAAARSLVPVEDSPTLLVNFGARATDVAVVRDGMIVLTRSIATAGEAFTRALATSLGMEKAQAEEYKKAYGLEQAQLEGKIRQALGPIFDSVVAELKRAMAFYQEHSGGDEVKQVVLMGGTAGLPQATGLMAEKLGVEVQVGNPFQKIIETPELVQLAETAPLYAVALGLAMREGFK